MCADGKAAHKLSRVFRRLSKHVLLLMYVQQAVAVCQTELIITLVSTMHAQRSTQTMHAFQNTVCDRRLSGTKFPQTTWMSVSFRSSCWIGRRRSSSGRKATEADQTICWRRTCCSCAYLCMELLTVVAWLLLLVLASPAPRHDTQCTIQIRGSVGISVNVSAVVKCSGPDNVRVTVAPILARFIPTFTGAYRRLLYIGCLVQHRYAV